MIPRAWVAERPSATAIAISTAASQGSGHEARRECLAFQKLGDGVGDVAMGSDVVDRQDVGMRQGRDGPGLPLEASRKLGIAGETLGEDLDRNLARQPRIPRPV